MEKESADTRLFISKLELKNIRCFEDLTINFGSEDGLYSIVSILGDNGVGKTTVLRSIAMGSCEAGSVAGLIDDLYGEWIKEGEQSGTIRVEYSSDINNQSKFYIHTQIERGHGGTSAHISQTTYPESKDFPWGDIFICGYGATRQGGSSTRRSLGYRVVEAIYSLFSENVDLYDAEVILRRIEADKISYEDVLKWVDRILMLPEGSLSLTKTGLNVSGPWGQSIPFIALADGHRMTATWLIDILGWALLFDESMFRKGISGIVLIDEIEQHLHPIWQKTILTLLRTQFPNIQFIVTSHSPLVATGMTDLSNKDCSIVLLNRNENGSVGVHDRLQPPRNQRADQILTSYLFGLSTSGDNVISQKIGRYSKLAGKDRNGEEEKELMALSDELNGVLGTEETDLQQIVADEVHKALQNNLQSLSLDPKALDFEIKRRFLELFKTD